MEVSDIFKIVGPSPLRSWMIQDRVRQNECFYTTFLEKKIYFTNLTPRTPPSVIHGWKATDLLYEMVRRKNYWRNPISRQNFANALAENHNLKLEVCLMLFCGKISLLCNLRCFVAKSVLSLFTRFGVEKNWAKNFVCGEKRTNIRYD